MDNGKRLLVGVMLLVCLLTGSVSAGAQVSAQGSLYQTPYVTVAGENNRKWSPAVAYDSNHNEYLVVWETIETGGQHNIYGRRITAGGTLLGEFLVFSDTIYGRDSLQPSVAYDSAHDRYLVVWSYAYSSTDHDIYGRYIPWDGPSPSLPYFGIDATSDNSDKPRVAYGSLSDRFLVVWRVLGASSYSIKDVAVLNNGGLDSNTPSPPGQRRVISRMSPTTPTRLGTSL
jgi:hypothetical protein